MPINKNDDGQMTLLLGIGDVLIFRGKKPDRECESILLFKQDYKENPLYEKIPQERYDQEFKGKNTDEVPCELAIEFISVEDIDALLNDLNKLREKMLEEQS